MRRLIVALMLIAAAPPTAHSKTADVVESPVSFRVVNANTSRYPCASDGALYTMRGYLISPGRAASAVSLYVHGSVFPGQFIWRLKGVPGYDHAFEMARMGFTSVVIDRVGFGTSDVPVGYMSCVGSQASMIHQVILALRSGAYEMGAGRGPAFRTVVVVGHSFGGAVVNAESYSFRDADGAIIIGSAFTQGFPAELAPVAAGLFAACLQAQRKFDGGPIGYAPLFQDIEREWLFGDPYGPAVDALLPHRELETCGDALSVLEAASIDTANMGKITAPVLLLFGDKDRIFPPDEARRQRTLYSGSADVTLTFIVGAGHDPQFERSVKEFRALIGGWLARRFNIEGSRARHRWGCLSSPAAKTVEAAATCGLLCPVRFRGRKWKQGNPSHRPDAKGSVPSAAKRWTTRRLP